MEQKSLLDFSFKGALQKASSKKKKYAKHSLKDKADDLVQQALWEKAGGRIRCCWASAGSENDQTVPWDKDATCMNNWTVLWNTDLNVQGLKPEHCGPHTDSAILTIHRFCASIQSYQTGVRLMWICKGKLRIRYIYHLLHFNSLFSFHPFLHLCALLWEMPVFTGIQEKFTDEIKWFFRSGKTWDWWAGIPATKQASWTMGINQKENAFITDQKVINSSSCSYDSFLLPLQFKF